MVREGHIVALLRHNHDVLVEMHELILKVRQNPAKDQGKKFLCLSHS